MGMDCSAILPPFGVPPMYLRCVALLVLAIALCAAALPTSAEEPVKLGLHTQLMVDDVLLAAKEGVVRTAHACRKLPKPVIEPERPWEGSRTYIYGTVLGDAAAGQFRMWYMSRNQTQPARDPQLTCAKADLVLYATSSDGVQWRRPDLGLFEYNGSKQNNIVFGLHSPSVLYDAGDADPSRRYKMLGCGKGGKSAGYCAAVSPDGLHWSAVAENPVLKHGDTITLAYDSARHEYLAFHKMPGKHRGFSRRMVYLAMSRDFRTWSEPQLVLAPDEQDDAWAKEPEQRTEFYNLSVFPCGGQFLGLVTVFKKMRRLAKIGPEQSADDGPIDVQLVHSRDGRNWRRCEDRSPVIPNGPYAYDAGCILGVCNTPVFHEDQMLMYYTAITTTHGGAIPEKRISVARAAWPKDRLVSLDAAAEGRVETVLFRPAGNRLRVNADASAGSLAVEVLDAQGQAIPGYTAANCQTLTADRLDHAVCWHDRAALPGDRPIRLRFHLRHASLFAFAIDAKTDLSSPK
jgi:hypothetical protein